MAKHYSVIVKPPEHNNSYSVPYRGFALFDFQCAAKAAGIEYKEQEVEIITGYKRNGADVYDKGQVRKGLIAEATFTDKAAFDAFQQAVTANNDKYNEYFDFVEPEPEEEAPQSVSNRAAEAELTA